MESALTASDIESLAYPLSYDTSNLAPVSSENRKVAMNQEKRMGLKCKSCGAEFDSTFSVEDFSLLSKNQYEAGTLHICPNCGSLSIYELKDYREPK